MGNYLTEWDPSEGTGIKQLAHKIHQGVAVILVLLFLKCLQLIVVDSEVLNRFGEIKGFNGGCGLIKGEVVE